MLLTMKGYGLEDRCSIPDTDMFLSFQHRVKTGSEAHSASCPMDTKSPLPGVTWPRRQGDHLSPSSAEVKNAWSYTSTPMRFFMS